jgi:hypothetical protein
MKKIVLVVIGLMAVSNAIAAADVTVITEDTVLSDSGAYDDILVVRDNAVVDITITTVYAGTLYVLDSATVNITFAGPGSNAFIDYINTYDSSTINISSVGLEIDPVRCRILQCYGNSAVNINNATIEDLVLYGHSVANLDPGMAGGGYLTDDSTLNMMENCWDLHPYDSYHGYLGISISAEDNSTVNLYGKDLIAVPYGGKSDYDNYGFVEGTSATGVPFELFLQHSDDSTYSHINLHDNPPAATMESLGAITVSTFSYKKGKSLGTDTLQVAGQIVFQDDTIDLSVLDISLVWGADIIKIESGCIAKVKDKKIYRINKTTAPTVTGTINLESDTYVLSVKKASFAAKVGSEKFTFTFE